MKRIAGIIFIQILCLLPLTSQGQSTLYKRFEKSKDVEVYFMKEYKEIAGCKMDATLVRYNDGDRVRCRQVFSQIMNATSGLTSYRQVQNKKLVSSYWYAKGKVLIIHYKVAEGRVDCMSLEGPVSQNQAKAFLDAMAASKAQGALSTQPSKPQVPSGTRQEPLLAGTEM